MSFDTTPVSRTGEFDRALGQSIRSQRIRRGMTQQDLASAIGVTYQQAHKYERGTNRVSAARLVEIAGVFGISLAELLPGASGESRLPKEENRQTLEMARHFARISDPAHRQAVYQLIRLLAEKEEAA